MLTHLFLSLVIMVILDVKVKITMKRRR